MLRSTSKALEAIKKQDPDTSITQYTIRRWCLEGKIKYIMSGNKILVNLESLLDFVNCEDSPEPKNN